MSVALTCAHGPHTSTVTVANSSGEVLIYGMWPIFRAGHPTVIGAKASTRTSDGDWTTLRMHCTRRTAGRGLPDRERAVQVMASFIHQCAPRTRCSLQAGWGTVSCFRGHPKEITILKTMLPCLMLVLSVTIEQLHVLSSMHIAPSIPEQRSHSCAQSISTFEHQRVAMSAQVCHEKFARQSYTSSDEYHRPLGLVPVLPPMCGYAVASILNHLAAIFHTSEVLPVAFFAAASHCSVPHSSNHPAVSPVSATYLH